MKIKRVIILALAAVMCLPVCGLAEDADSYAALFDITQSEETDGSLFTIDIVNNFSAGDTGAVLILPEKVDGTDVTADGIIGDNEILEAIMAEENYEDDTYTFYMPEYAQPGGYTIVAGGTSVKSNVNLRSHKFYYGTDVTGGNNFIINNELTSANLEEGLKNGYFYIDTTDGAYVSDPSAVAKIVDDLKPATQFEVEEAFRIACDFVASEKADSIMLEMYVDERNSKLGFDLADDAYVADKENVLRIFKVILDGKNGATEVKNLQDLRDTFFEACAVSYIDKTTDTSVTIDNLKKYNSLFKLDFTTKLPYIDEYEVAKVITSTRYDSVDAIVKDYNDRVNELYDAYLNNQGNSGTGGGSGGSSGGFGGGSGGGVSVISDVNQEKFNEFTGNQSVFPDVSKSHWASNYIDFCFRNHIMIGDGDGNFRPDDEITRSEFVKTILCAFGVDTTDAECSFLDVSKASWAYPFIAKAYEIGCVKGVAEDSFAPDSSISRQDAVTMLFRLASMAREGVEFKAATLEFTDADAIADYAQDSVAKLVEINVIGGYEDGSFMPEKTISRAETAKIIMTLLEAVN